MKIPSGPFFNFDTMKEIFKGVYRIENKLATLNAVPGKSVYGEKLIRFKEKEYREWDPFRSKLAGAIENGLKEFPIKEGIKILYLGASTGTTVSHISDIVKNSGLIFSVEVSAEAMKKLIQLAESRENIVPILADARNYESYREIGEVDLIYEDISQPDQAEILLANSVYLKERGWAMFCVKSKNIDSIKKPKEVFEEVKKKINIIYEIKQEIKLEPYDKDHLFLLLQKRQL